jgi:hypothetical protein
LAFLLKQSSILAGQQMFLILPFFVLCFFAGSLHAHVPQYAGLSDFAPDMFSAVKPNRHVFVHAAVGFAEDKYGQGSANLGIYQPFNLKDLAKSADVYSREMGNGPYTPEMLELMARWRDKNIPFSTITSLRAQRVSVAYHDFVPVESYAETFEEGSIKKRLAEGAGIAFGISLPFVQSQSVNQYSLNRYGEGAYADIRSADPLVESKADMLRAELFKKIGLAENVCDQRGLGDIECYLGVQTHTDYYLRLRSLDANLLLAASFPTGGKKDSEYPSAIPHGMNSFGLSLQSNFDFGLKDYMHVGFNTGIVFFSTRSAIIRTPIYQEPMAFSPLVAAITTLPGQTYWFNPFFSIKNIASDLHVTINYSFVWHAADGLFDERRNVTSKSVFSRDVNDDLGISFKDRNLAKDKIVKMSEWSSRTLGMTLTYDPYQVSEKRSIVPYFNFGFQYIHNGVNIPVAHQLNASICLQF